MWMKWLLIASLVLSGPGCVTAVTKTVGTAASVGVKVGTGAVKTGVSVAGAGVDAVTPDGEDEHAEMSHHDGGYPEPYDETRDAHTDIDETLLAAQVSGKRVLLVLGGNWCHDSRSLAAKFEDPFLAGVIERGYELVFVDVGHRDRNLDVSQRFGVEELFGTPTVLILSPLGRLVNSDSVHDWRTADDKPLAEVTAYFQRYSLAE